MLLKPTESALGNSAAGEMAAEWTMRNGPDAKVRDELARWFPNSK